MSSFEQVANSDLAAQCAALEDIVLGSPLLSPVLKAAASVRLPNWYLGAGAIAQTVWNIAHEYDAAWGIADCDLVYFDASDLSYAAEDKVISAGRRLLRDSPVEIQIRNQARVHLWYQQKFGKPIPPYRSAEEAINTWPSTATCVGVTTGGAAFRIYAPFGLHDLFAMIIRPNKTLVPRHVYEAKVSRWAAAWPKLRIAEW